MADPAYYVAGATDRGIVKEELHIPTATTLYDGYLDEKGLEGNRQVEDILYIHAVTLPLTLDQFTSARYMVFSYIYWRYMVFTKNWEAAKEYKALYDAAKEALIAKLTAQPNVNTQSGTVAYARSYRSDELADRSTN